MKHKAKKRSIKRGPGPFNKHPFAGRVRSGKIVRGPKRRKRSL